jgi:hypothetical protein
MADLRVLFFNFADDTKVPGGASAWQQLLAARDFSTRLKDEPAQENKRGEHQANTCNRKYNITHGTGVGESRTTSPTAPTKGAALPGC